MSKNAFTHRAFARFTLVAALVLASLPAQARETRSPVRHAHAVAVPGDGIWGFVLNLLPQGMWKEGMSIDPNGAPGQQGAAANPSKASGDEGMTIDPNGRQ
jgi:hypothetical protein